MKVELVKYMEAVVQLVKWKRILQQMVNYPSVARKIKLTVLYVGVATDQKRKQHTQNKHENYLFIKVYSMDRPPVINLGG